MKKCFFSAERMYFTVVNCDFRTKHASVRKYLFSDKEFRLSFHKCVLKAETTYNKSEFDGKAEF